MEKIRKKPIAIPQEIEIEIKDSFIKIKGPKGEVQRKTPKEICIEKKRDKLSLSFENTAKKSIKKTKALIGLYYKIFENDIIGLTSGFEKKLEIRGIGYGAQVADDGNLSLKVGFSHPVIVKKEEGVELVIEKNIITIKGTDKEKVGNLAAKIRKIKPPDPYKGKGIRYLNEEVRKKEGKRAVASK